MNVPDKHKALAHAWVDGAEIECKKINCSIDKWSFINPPTWQDDFEYRIKPKKVRFWQNYQESIFMEFDTKEDVEIFPNFKKWLTDWVDYVG